MFFFSPSWFISFWFKKLIWASSNHVRILCSQIISVTGFVDTDRDDLKLMAYLAGARYTGYLCRSNTVLICKEWAPLVSLFNHSCESCTYLCLVRMCKWAVLRWSSLPSNSSDTDVNRNHWSVRLNWFVQRVYTLTVRRILQHPSPVTVSPLVEKPLSAPTIIMMPVTISYLCKSVMCLQISLCLCPFVMINLVSVRLCCGWALVVMSDSLMSVWVTCPCCSQAERAEVREGQGVADPMCERPVALRHPDGELWGSEAGAAQQVLPVQPAGGAHAQPAPGPQPTGWAADQLFLECFEKHIYFLIDLMFSHVN